MVPGETTQIVPVQTMSPAADEPRVLCIILDVSKSQEKSRTTVNLPASTTGGALAKQVGKMLQYHVDTFDLVLQRKIDGNTVTIDPYSSETLDDIGFCCDDNNRNTLIVDNKNGMAPIKIQPDDWTNDSDTKSDGGGDASSTYVPPPAPPPYTSGSADYLCSYGCNSVAKQETGYVGLVNQAMTCYLNSLLQTLYMTPEFRNALYRWEFDGTEEEGTKSIPFQLQKLFLLLQTSKKSAVGTTELTTSFGWDSSEAWQQHDVQELCRVMFDALEQKFKNTEQSDLISTLYEGKLKDYVKCLECSHESAREDTFLDVPLVVRPFGSSQAYGSVEEALHAFVTPETLQGCNQYFCEKCNKKCDAHKGLKFTKFPYLLTLQLKRFDFDPLTMHRIKLNDRVSFPEILNLNEFMKLDKTEDSLDDGDTTDSGSALDDEGLGCSGGCKTVNSLSPESLNENVDPTDDDEGIDVEMHPSNMEGCHDGMMTERNIRKSMEKGPYTYELFSIMVHSGSANGGHYYAYIKSFHSGEWYCFNDAQVTRITYDDIEKTYGGGPKRGFYSRAYSSSMNAYMLMYRQIDKSRNDECMTTDAFPEHIKVLLQCMQDQEERERQQKEMDRYMCTIKLFCRPPNQKLMKEMMLKVHKDDTLAQVTATAYRIMGLDGIVSLDCCRLVKYDDFHDSLESSFDSADDEPIGELLGGVKSSYKFDLLLEIKEPHEEFREYKPGGTTVKVHNVDLVKGDVDPTPLLTLRCNLTETVAGFREQLSQCLGVPASKIRLVLEVYNNEMEYLDDSSSTLKSEGFGKSSKVFIEFKDAEDYKKPFPSSKLSKTLERHFHTICIHVSLPTVDKFILEKLRINCPDAEKEDSNSDDEASEVRIPIAGGTMGHQVSKMCGGIKNKFYTGISPCANNKDSSNLVTSNSQLPWTNDGKGICLQSGIELTRKNQTTPEDPSLECDEGLGDSEIGDPCSSNGYQVGYTVHSDQSEDSSLTDSERTLVGDELSPRNNSPDIMGSEIEPDAEPPQVSSLEMSRPESDSAHSSSESNFQLDEQTEDNTNPSSPEENAKDPECCKSNCSKNCVCDNNQITFEPPRIVVKPYFRAFPYTEYETGKKMLRVYVDKRMTLNALKKELEPFVGVPADCFKVFKLYSVRHFECTRLNENLMAYSDDTKLLIKLGRSLRKGEYKVNVYQLSVNDPEPIRFLTECIFVRDMTVLQAKKEILPEIKETCELDVPLNRCRLRKKSWKNPGIIFLDNQRFEKDIPINSNWEVFLEILDQPEPVTSPSQLTVFTRRWHPSSYQLDLFQEVVIAPDVNSLKSKLSEISGIPIDYVEFAKGQGTFPCEVSLLSIHKELDWFSQKTCLSTWMLGIGDEGLVVYYRDSREELKKLSEEEKREITNKENARSNKIQKSSFSPRKEKALKIYTIDSTPSKSNSSSSNNTTESSKFLVPDLD